MKITAAALAVFALAGSAHAYMFSPKHKTFKLDGQVTVEGDTYHCKLEATGTTHGERATITSAALVGNPNCKALIPHRLPWKVEISDTGQLIIRHMRFGFPNPIHAGRQPVTVDGSGNWTFIATPDLYMSGTVASKPPITIQP